MPSAKPESRDPTEEINWPAQISRKSCKCANRLTGIFLDISGSNLTGLLLVAGCGLRNLQGMRYYHGGHQTLYELPAQGFDMRRPQHGVMVPRHRVDL